MRRIVVKIGSNALTRPDGRLDVTRMSALVDQIAWLRAQGCEVILVSSGAVACGRRELDIEHELDSVEQRQLFSAMGQAKLIGLYYDLFREYHIHVGQVLTMKENFQPGEQYRNQQACMRVMLENGVLPIVNENDTVSTYEIEFGDNDTLSAVVAAVVGADLLILLSDIDGLYTDDPRKNPDAKFIEVVEKLTDDYMEMGKGSTGSNVGTGGMNTKLVAGKIATKTGCDMIICNSSDIGILHRIMDGENVGTLFLANRDENFNLPEYIDKLHKN